MAMTDGHLTLSPACAAADATHADRPPVPLAGEIQKSRSVGVILSGNGTDGVIALQSIKAAGGVTFAQDEATARYPEHAAGRHAWTATSTT